MYVRSRCKLDGMLADRRANREEISRQRDDYIRLRFGIPDFSSLVAKHWGHLQDSEKSVGVLCRQQASIMVEDVSCYIGCLCVGLLPWVGQFARDEFRTVNLDKLHRVKIPWITWSKKGNLVMKYERISPLTNGRLEGMRMASVPTHDGVTLPEWHARLRQLVFGERYPVSDFSVFMEDCLEQAVKKPDFVYTSDANGYEAKVRCNGKVHGLRPPASWYYPLYFSLFLDGTMVLLETYENTLSGVPAAKRLFEDSMRELTKGVGVQPVVAEIPPLTHDMMYYNRHLLDAGLDVEDIMQKVSGEDDIVVLMTRIAEIVRRIGCLPVESAIPL